VENMPGRAQQGKRLRDRAHGERSLRAHRGLYDEVRLSGLTGEATITLMNSRRLKVRPQVLDKAHCIGLKPAAIDLCLLSNIVLVLMNRDQSSRGVPFVFNNYRKGQRHPRAALGQGDCEALPFGQDFSA
jgi:hypothetical protein